MDVPDTEWTKPTLIELVTARQSQVGNTVGPVESQFGPSPKQYDPPFVAG